MPSRLKLLEQIEEFVFSGLIRGNDILTIQRLFKAYERGEVMAEVLQKEINAFDPETHLEMPRDE